MLQALLIVTMLFQQSAPSDGRIASIQVKGTKRYTVDEVTRLSGVEIGKPATPNDLTAAANRLASTGLFDSVRYTYTTGRVMTVTFEVEEASWNIPVILDNFVWLSDEQLAAAVRATVPSFDGTVPANVGAIDFLAQAVQRVLKARGVPGRVEYTTHTDMRVGKPSYVLSVKDPAPHVCALHIKGAAAIPERDLLAPLQAAVGGEYSRFFVETASKGTLTDMYRRKGYWAAAFGAAVPALNECEGVSVTLPVTEGEPYAWDRAEWSGASALDAAALDKALAMKPGEPADASKIDNGVREVRRAYGRHGYIESRVEFEPRLDSATRKAAFVFKITEGAQYRMGDLQSPGLRDADAAMLMRKFPLKTGDVYDDSAVLKYEREVLGPLQTKGGGRGHVEAHPDPAAHVVNVKIVFGGND